MSLLKRFAAEAKEVESEKLIQIAEDYRKLSEEAQDVLLKQQQLERAIHEDSKSPLPSKQ